MQPVIDIGDTVKVNKAPYTKHKFKVIDSDGNGHFLLLSITKDKKKQLEITKNKKVLELVSKTIKNEKYRDTKGLKGFKF